MYASDATKIRSFERPQAPAKGAYWDVCLGCAHRGDRAAIRGDAKGAYWDVCLGCLVGQDDLLDAADGREGRLLGCMPRMPVLCDSDRAAARDGEGRLLGCMPRMHGFGVVVAGVVEAKGAYWDVCLGCSVSVVPMTRA